MFDIFKKKKKKGPGTEPGSEVKVEAEEKDVKPVPQEEPETGTEPGSEVEVEAETEQETQPTPDPSPSKPSWLSKLKSGMSKSSSKLNEGIKDIFVRRKLDDQTLEELEDLLISSDLGVETAATVTSNLAKNKFDKEISPEEIKTELASVIGDILQDVAVPLAVTDEHKPQVILMCGVNGTGKTTTIGKLASSWKNEGKLVMIAACDTFRAAAVEQLEVWAKRAGCPIIKGKEGSDPASVAYEAYDKAKSEGADVLIIDTAGRLQNKKNLMEQLTKIVKVVKKLDESAPHNSIIVLDATTGQNANSQVKVFGEMVNLNGIIVTKLDGTAKGGVVVSLAKQFGLPMHAVGVGEGIDDLKAFDPKEFAESLVG